MKRHQLIFCAALITAFLFTPIYAVEKPADIEINQDFLARVNQMPVDDALTPQSQAALKGFYHDLRQLERGERSQLTILQLGDSHTANDFLTGRLRQHFQEAYGNAGRGMMPPGIVYKGLSHPDVKPSMDSGWSIENSFKEPQKGPFGISGFVARSTSTGARMQLTAVTLKDGFDEVAIDYLTQPGGGKFQVLLDDKTVAVVSTAGPANQSKHFALKAPQRSYSLTVVALAKDIGITAWGTSRAESGVVLVSHGIVGTTASLFKHWSQSIMQADLEHLQPSLIIVAYGTNDGFATDFNPKTYTQLFIDLLLALQHMAPDASILVIGPPDAEKVSETCPPAIAKNKISQCNFSPPPALAQVRAIERQAAEAVGADFWDWSSLMPQGIKSWVDAGLGRSDRVHFKPAGYEASADQLFARLLTGYKAAGKNSPQSRRSRR